MNNEKPRKRFKRLAFFTALIGFVTALLVFNRELRDLVNNGTEIPILREVFPVKKPNPEIVLRSDPVGALVTLDGKPEGKTELKIKLAPGKHHLRVELAGYEPVESTFELDSSGAGSPGLITLKKHRKSRSMLETFELVQKDLEKIAPERRSLRRYLTLSHDYNNLELSDKILAERRQFLKAHATCFQLGTGKDPVHFVPLDAEETVWVFDLQLFGWDANNHWKTLIRSYPYAVSYGEASEPLKTAEASITQQTKTPLFLIRGDWFLANAQRSSLTTPTIPETLKTWVAKFSKQELDFASITAEIESSPEKIKKAIQDSMLLRDQYGLSPLLDGKTIPRAKWESLDLGLSAFQQLVIDLGIAQAKIIVP